MTPEQISTFETECRKGLFWIEQSVPKISELLQRARSLHAQVKAEFSLWQQWKYGDLFWLLTRSQ